MKVHNDLSPTHKGVRIDPALVLSHDRNLTATKTTADEAAGKHRKAKQIAKTEGVDLDILKTIKTRAKHTGEDNIAWLNKLLDMAKTFMVPGLEAVPFQGFAKPDQDEEQMLRDRYELGLLHGRSGLDAEFNLMDLATPAGQEYKKGHDQGAEDFKNLQPILMSKMEAPPTISKDDPGVHQGDEDEGETSETEAQTSEPPAAPAKSRRGRPSNAEKAARAAAKPAAAPAEPPKAEAKPKGKAKDKAAAPPVVETPGILPSDDEEFAPRKDVVEKPAVPFLN